MTELTLADVVTKRLRELFPSADGREVAASATDCADEAIAAFFEAYLTACALTLDAEVTPKEATAQLRSAERHLSVVLHYKAGLSRNGKTRSRWTLPLKREFVQTVRVLSASRSVLDACVEARQKLCGEHGLPREFGGRPATLRTLYYKLDPTAEEKRRSPRRLG